MSSGFVSYRSKSMSEIHDAMVKQARGKKVAVNCPNCGHRNHIDAADILTGGKDVRCAGCPVTFRLEGMSK